MFKCPTSITGPAAEVPGQVAAVSVPTLSASPHDTVLVHCCICWTDSWGTRAASQPCCSQHSAPAPRGSPQPALRPFGAATGVLLYPPDKKPAPSPQRCRPWAPGASTEGASCAAALWPQSRQPHVPSLPFSSSSCFCKHSSFWDSRSPADWRGQGVSGVQ